MHVKMLEEYADTLPKRPKITNEERKKKEEDRRREIREIISCESVRRKKGMGDEEAQVNVKRRRPDNRTMAEKLQ